MFRKVYNLSSLILKFPKRFITSNTHTLKANSIYESNHITSKVKSEEKELYFNQPMEALLAVLNTCELKAISYWANHHKVTLPKIEIETKGTWSNSAFIPETEFNPKENTYKELELVINVYAKKDEKLLEVIEKGTSTCPVLNTIKLAGAKFNHRIEFKN